MTQPGTAEQAPPTPQPTRGAGPARSLDPTAAEVWRSARGPVLVAAAVLAAAVVLAIVGGGPANGLLDPRAVDPAGSRALAEILRDEGVEVRLVTTTSGVAAQARPGDTLLVAFPDRLLRSQSRAVRDSGADLVVVAPTSPQSFTRGVRAVDAEEPDLRDPLCELPAATRAGRADAGGLVYAVTRAIEADLCYPNEGRPSLVQVRDAGRTVTFLGSPAALRNDRLGEEGNAALVMGLLGSHERLLWYLPSLDDVPAGETKSFYDLVPDALWWAVAQLAVAVLVLALWRGRRLGPVVAEPLPVVVRAAETVEGRARLYRRSGARGQAAAALRAGLLARLVPQLGLPRSARPEAVVDAVAARTDRRPQDVHLLLYGAAPPDDAALVRFADDLDALERQVRRP